jgi:hypothetical protein
MSYRIAIDGDIVRAQLQHRESIEEMRSFLTALARYARSHTRLLIEVRASRPIFQFEPGGLLALFRAVARSPAHRVALVADNRDLQASHEYFELIARQRGLNVRSLESEAEALRWLRQRERGIDRRRQPERRRERDRRHGVERRR